jgi:hypothetical protein
VYPGLCLQNIRSKLRRGFPLLSLMKRTVEQGNLNIKMSSLYFKIRKNESLPDWAQRTHCHLSCPKYNADIARYSDVFSG